MEPAELLPERRTAGREAEAMLDDLVMSDSESEESPLLVSEGEDDEEDDAVLPADDDDGFAMDMDNEEAAYQAEYLDRLLLTEDEDEDEDEDF